jgi:hypothetical protein
MCPSFHSIPWCEDASVNFARRTQNLGRTQLCFFVLCLQKTLHDDVLLFWKINVTTVATKLRQCQSTTMVTMTTLLCHSSCQSKEKDDEEGKSSKDTHQILIISHAAKEIGIARWSMMMIEKIQYFGVQYNTNWLEKLLNARWTFFATPRYPQGRGLRGPILSVGDSVCRCVDGSICTVLPLHAYTTKTCFLHVSSIK